MRRAALGRSVPEDTVPVAARLPHALVDKLDQLAPSLGGTRSDALRTIVDEYEAFPPPGPEAPLFAPALPAPRGARAVSFGETRYDRVGSR
jgi:hypothetical protein